MFSGALCQAKPVRESFLWLAGRKLLRLQRKPISNESLSDRSTILRDYPISVLRSQIPPTCLLHLTQSLRTFSRLVRHTLLRETPPRPLNHLDSILIQVQRAQELVAVNKNLGALELLHDHVISKRTRNSPIASLEPVMILFVELCVSLRKGKTAKDGLYQYKNIAQNTSVQTIEVCSTSGSCILGISI